MNLGDTVRDKVTGLEGIATSRCTYLNGCDHIAIQPRAKDGRIPPAQWVDYPQVEVIESLTVRPEARPVRTGGPAIHPPSVDDSDYDTDCSTRTEDMYTRSTRG